MAEKLAYPQDCVSSSRTKETHFYAFVRSPGKYWWGSVAIKISTTRTDDEQTVVEGR